MWEAAPSAWERVKRAKLRETEAHRRAINLHTSTAAHFESTGREAQAIVVRESAEHARAMRNSRSTKLMHLCGGGFRFPDRRALALAVRVGI
jgi:hypothetical protein